MGFDRYTLYVQTFQGAISSILIFSLAISSILIFSFHSGNQKPVVPRFDFICKTKRFACLSRGNLAT